MTIKSKLKTFFFLDDGHDDIDPEEINEESAQIKPLRQPVKNNNVVNLQSVSKTSLSKVVLVEPKGFSESAEIADHLKNRRAVVVNLQRIEKDQAQKIVDFLGGAVYVLNGDIQKIGADTFLCTPDNVEISGNISELLSDGQNWNSRW